MLEDFKALFNRSSFHPDPVVASSNRRARRFIICRLNMSSPHPIVKNSLSLITSSMIIGT
uniref:Uncharacterized protein n=1 Tax=Kalanchoe fedtschenkoi TaxID=63787 RepID=A0A7N0ZW40_KALFE